MPTIQPCELPPTALLRRHRHGGAFADCYVIDIRLAVTHAEFVEAFYTTGLFKLERLLLRWLAARPSTDAQARQLAAGEADTFAAWRVEGREPGQLLLADLTGRTRSWLMVEGAPAGTRLYFGSAVISKPGKNGGPPRMGALFEALLGFHRLYSRALLQAAHRRLLRRT